MCTCHRPSRSNVLRRLGRDWRPPRDRCESSSSPGRSGAISLRTLRTEGRRAHTRNLVVMTIDPCDYGRMKHGTSERVRDGMERLSGAKLDLAPLIDEAGRLIAQVVPFEGACWHTMDPATLIETSVRMVNLPPHN